MENSGQGDTFGNIMRRSLVEPFFEAYANLKVLAPADLEAQTLLEVAGTVTYDQSICCFYQVYPEVPGLRGKNPQTVRFPMKLEDVSALAQAMSARLQ